MKNNNLELKKIKKQLDKFLRAESRHAVFLAIMIVLLAYLFMVWQISQLATAEPSDDTALVQAQIPKIDKNAIRQIQSLEQNNTDVHSLFNSARNNPFQE